MSSLKSTEITHTTLKVRVFLGPTMFKRHSTTDPRPEKPDAGYDMVSHFASLGGSNLYARLFRSTLNQPPARRFPGHYRRQNLDTPRLQG
jgi:hypothetical protein